jgi:hypothetical protein
MKISLYGVSRSGKNFLIERLLESFNKKEAKTLFHADGSGILERLSNEKYGIPLRETNESQRQQLRIMFYDELSVIENGYKHKIVDCHYCFYKNDSFEIAFNDRDRNVYDIFFYLDTPADAIIKRANLDEKKKDVAFMSEEKINKWKEFEIQSLRKICLDNNKEFVVLDSNVEDCIDFFETLFLRTRNILLDSKDIAKYIITEHKELIDKYKRMVIIDCDRTISNNDTTYDFCALMDIDKKELKNIFRGEHYSSYQFFRVAKIYTKKDKFIYENASIHASKKVILNTPLIEDIKQNSGNFLSVGITSGILQTWKIIHEQNEFPNIIIGGSNLVTDNFVVSRMVKYYLVKFLRENGKYVIAVGDSIVDIDMLNEADKGFIVAQDKVNETMKAYLSTFKTKIMQLEYSKLHYDGITIKRSIFL